MTGPAAPGAPAQPKEADVSDFGAIAALYDLATRLRIVECIDRHVSKRGGGPTVGTYLLVAAINRCVAPCSKASIADWFGSTSLRRLVDIETRQLTSQRFWDNMDRVSNAAISQAKTRTRDHAATEGNQVESSLEPWNLSRSARRADTATRTASLSAIARRLRILGCERERQPDVHRGSRPR